MAAEDAGKEGATWPMPTFRFEVDFGPDLKGVAFREVSGMDVENPEIEYRKSNCPLFSTHKMPGIAKFGNVTINKAVFVNDNSFWNWHKEITMNTGKKRTVLIKLLDETGSLTMQWQLDNA